MRGQDICTTLMITKQQQQPRRMPLLLLLQSPPCVYMLQYIWQYLVCVFLHLEILPPGQCHSLLAQFSVFIFCLLPTFLSSLYSTSLYSLFFSYSSILLKRKNSYLYDILHTKEPITYTRQTSPLSAPFHSFLMVPFCERHNDDEVFSFVVSRIVPLCFVCFVHLGVFSDETILAEERHQP